MFLEPINNTPEKRGHLEVICGSMFSGKTEELIRRLNRAIIANQPIGIFKPSLDKRYQDDRVVSHDLTSIQSVPVKFAEEILPLAADCEVVGIDEVQFFDQKIVQVVTDLANSGKRVILAGLDMDFEGNLFGPMPQLLAIAEYVTKVHAICMKCGNLASHSFRLTGSKETIMLGETESYEARCRKCFYEGKR